MTPRYSHYTTLNPCDKSTSLGRNRYSGLFSQVLLINPLTITVTITRKRRHPPFFRAATLFKLYGISPSQPLPTLARPFAKAYHNSVFLPEGSLKLKTWKPLATSKPWYSFRGGVVVVVVGKLKENSTWRHRTFSAQRRHLRRFGHFELSSERFGGKAARW